jgi:hypothetical protein
VIGTHIDYNRRNDLVRRPGAPTPNILQGIFPMSPTSPTSPDDRLLSPDDIAARWQIRLSSLANMRSRGRGPAFLKIGGRIRYRWSDVAAYERAGFHDPGATAAAA